MNQYLVRLAWRATPFKGVVKPMARAARDSMVAPWNWPRTARLCRILAIDYGHLRSAARAAAIDASGEPVPWLTYPAIEYVGRLDLSGKSVFEYGCGNSTRYWGREAGNVVSVEHEKEFYQLIAPQLPSNCELAFRSPAQVYVAALAEYSARRGRGFDVIVIDGHSRVRCAEGAAQHLAPGGMIILDNSDWFPEAGAHLRAAGLIEVSFTGFAPISDFTSMTSIYFHRSFDLPMKPDRTAGIGSIPKPKFTKVE
ncbi:MAG: SAM-dependent methyltransferase [Vicinamibacterales bacterium]